MRTLNRFFFVLLLLAAPFGCGDHECGTTAFYSGDMSVPVGGGDCVTDRDCPSPSFVCAYKIGDGCAAKGHCAPLPMPTCASFTPLCGCDGTQVRAGSCFYESGYASGPTTGATFCPDDGGMGD
jgi:hypothetical protein